MRTFYLIKEGFRNLWQNRLMAMAAVGVLVCCMLLTGFSYLVFASSDDTIEGLQEENKIAVFMEVDQTRQQVAEMQVQLQNMDHIAEVELYKKDDQIDILYGDDLSEDVLESFKEDNPLQDTFVVTLEGEAIEDLNLYNAMLSKLENLPGVEELKYEDEAAEATSKLGKVVMVLGGVVIAVLLVVSLFIIVNTIKLTVYNRRLEIYIMKSVGATDHFIRLPFVIEGWLMGLLAGGISYGLIALLYKTLWGSVDKMNIDLLRLAPFSEHWVVLLVGFLVGGMLVGILGSAISVHKHLHQEGGLHQ
ncbi:MAG: ABC transporter permease [Ruminococcaceae bacterium]|nr:ABC transporter permease [Oscillospiraceae bacterium]